MAVLDGLYFVPNRDFSTPVHHISIDDSCTYVSHQVKGINNDSKIISSYKVGPLSIMFDIYLIQNKIFEILAILTILAILSTY